MNKHVGWVVWNKTRGLYYSQTNWTTKNVVTARIYATEGAAENRRKAICRKGWEVKTISIKVS